MPGVAVFSGTPVVLPYYLSMLKEKGIDYRQEEYLSLLKDISLFIFHGKEDLNCLFRLTEKLAESLKAQSSLVQKRFTENGHSGMGKEDEEAFVNRLEML